MGLQAGTSRQYQFLFATGNRLTKFEDGTLTEYAYGDADELTAAGSNSFTYDQFLNMKTKLSDGNTTTFSWDFESNLVGIDFPGTSNDDSHEYDGMGRRMRSKFSGTANWTNYVWDEVDGDFDNRARKRESFVIAVLYLNSLSRQQAAKALMSRKARPPRSYS